MVSTKNAAGTTDQLHLHLHQLVQLRLDPDHPQRGCHRMCVSAPSVRHPSAYETSERMPDSAVLFLSFGFGV